MDIICDIYNSLQMKVVVVILYSKYQVGWMFG